MRLIPRSVPNESLNYPVPGTRVLGGALGTRVPGTPGTLRTRMSLSPGYPGTRVPRPTIPLLPGYPRVPGYLGTRVDRGPKDPRRNLEVIKSGEEQPFPL
eukprot:220119-Rhodomonas_salina.1